MQKRQYAYIKQCQLCVDQADPTVGPLTAVNVAVADCISQAQPVLPIKRIVPCADLGLQHSQATVKVASDRRALEEMGDEIFRIFSALFG